MDQDGINALSKVVSALRHQSSGGEGKSEKKVVDQAVKHILKSIQSGLINFSGSSSDHQQSPAPPLPPASILLPRLTSRRTRPPPSAPLPPSPTTPPTSTRARGAEAGKAPAAAAARGNRGGGGWNEPGGQFDKAYNRKRGAPSFGSSVETWRRRPPFLMADLLSLKREEVRASVMTVTRDLEQVRKLLMMHRDQRDPSVLSPEQASVVHVEFR